MRTTWTTTLPHQIVSRTRPDRVRNLRALSDCQLTPTGVDVVTQRVVVHQRDVLLPSVLPLAFERHYASSWSHRDSVLGYGWSHTLDQALWSEPGRIVYRAADGREIEFDTFDLPGRALRLGDEIPDRLDEFVLRFHANNDFRVRTRQQTQLVFMRIPGDAHPDRARLVAIRHPAGAAIELTYDGHARLVSTVDTARRKLRFDYDNAGRLASVSLPDLVRDTRSEYRYEYDASGDLVRTLDVMNQSATYQYVDHLLVTRTDRAGMSCHFGFDGLGSDARCVRTWASRGILDRQIGRRRTPGTVVRDALGHRTLVDANAVHQILAIDRKTVQYDGALRPIAQYAAYRRPTWREFDADGNVIRAHSAEGGIYEIEYDAQQHPVRLFDANGALWEWKYDMFGQLLTEQTPLGEQMLFEHGAGLLRSIVIPSRGRIELVHDDVGHLREVRNPDGTVTRAEYDERSRLVRLIDARGYSRSFTYDALGRLETVAGPDGWTERYEYDGEGHLLAATRGSLRTRWQYVGAHWVSVRGDPQRRNARMRYDFEGRLVAARSESGDIARYVRDKLGRVVSEQTLEGTKIAYRWTPGHGLSRATFGTSSRVQWAYSAAGRLERVTSSDGATETFAYDPDGSLREGRNASIRTVLDRDAAGRVIREWQGSNWVDSSYDIAGNRVEVRTSLGARVVYIRDGNGRAKAVCHGDPGAAQWRVDFERDALGAEVRRMLPGGVVAHCERMPAGLPLRQTVRVGDAVVGDVGFQWDADRRLVRTIDREVGPTHYQRDVWGRVIAVHTRGRPAHYRTMDSVGDVFRTPDGSDAEYTSGGMIRAAGGFVFHHDDAGRLVERSDSAGQRWRYEWSALGLLQRVVRPDGGSIEYAYDVFGRRIRRAGPSGETRWIWDGNVPIHEIGPDGVTTWIFEPESFVLLGKIRPGRAHAAVVDPRGAPWMLFDPQGAIAWRGRVNVFGELSRDVSQTRCPWRWPGHAQDDDAELYYARYRYFSTLTGRYISPNPLGLFGGTNPYRYVDDPMTETDPWGLLGAGDALGLTRSVRQLVPFAELIQSRVRDGAARVLAKMPEVPSGDRMLRATAGLDALDAQRARPLASLQSIGHSTSSHEEGGAPNETL